MNSLRSVRALRAPSRIATFKHSQIRQFHPTRPNRIVNEVLDAAATLIHGVHSVTGLPWYASIPLTALIVRTFVGLPLQIITRVNARREADIKPLIHSWRVHYMKKERPLQRQEDKAALQQAAKQLKAQTRHLKKRWKVMPFYRIISVLQIPVWLAVMESLRGMSGNESGLVPRVLSLIEMIEPGNRSAESIHLTVEPTLANEGALWFPDLLAGDPTGTLTVVLALSILLNVRKGWNTIPMLEMADMPRLQMFQATTFRSLRVCIQIMALHLGATGFFHPIPAALALYWISSTSIATMQTYILEKYLYLRPPMEPYRQQYIAFHKPGVSDPFKNKLK